MKTFSRGFTLFEILIAIAIMALLATISLSLFKVNSQEALDTSAELVVSVLNEARTLTISSSNASQYGVEIGETDLTLFRGASYVSGASGNVINSLHRAVAVRNVTLSASSSAVVFQRFSGNATYAGTLEVYLKDNPERFYTISISNIGVVKRN